MKHFGHKVIPLWCLLSHSQSVNSLGLDALSNLSHTGTIRVPLENVRYSLSQVASSNGSTIGQGEVAMTLDNTENMGYVGEFYLGSESPQKIRALFDTGSANSWILSKEAGEIVSEAKKQEHNWFDKSLSTTFTEPEDDQKQWVKINFGSGYLNGYFVHDSCTLGDLDDASNQLVIENYMFGLVIENSAFTENFDAIVGMAYPEFAEPGVVPFFDGLMEEGVLDKNVFSFHMSMNPDEEASEMLLGGWDESRFTGDLSWYEVVNRRFFSIELDDILVDGTSLGLCQ